MQAERAYLEGGEGTKNREGNVLRLKRITMVRGDSSAAEVLAGHA